MRRPVIAIVVGMLCAVWMTSPAPAGEETVRFKNDVIPVLTKSGCNSGGCHGKATGKNGFKLSLLGYEPDLDYRTIVKEARGRRIFPADPEHSLLLLKASGRMPHGGGKRIDEKDEAYRLLRAWIAQGAIGPSDREPNLLRVEVAPGKGILQRNSQQQLQVTAFYDDGSRRDVTRLAEYQSNETAIAESQPSGLVNVANQSGQFAVMVRFAGRIATFHGTVPFASGKQAAEINAQLDALEKRLSGNPIDKLLIAQWWRLGITPSPPADDATFLRRATIDICGTLPTAEEVEAYLADNSPDKRRRLIDRLLERPEYASYFALKWADILQNRGRGYSTRRQRAGTARFAGWIRDSIAANKPYDRFVSEILTASGRQSENPPAYWFRTVRTQTNYVESVAQAFLGVRIQCAQCHHHPFERWSQDDYYGLAAIFARVGRKRGFADAEVPTDEIIYLKQPTPVLHPRDGREIGPRVLGGPDLELGPYADPRRSLVRWMTRKDNPFFARTMANRMWAHFLGRGIVHPIDDARDSNPPSNPELLDALSAEFANGGYDVKKLIRTICNSYAYRLTSAPTASNRLDQQSYARFYPRRLSAEVLLDGISQTLDVPTAFSGGPGAFPAGTRAIELPDENVPSNFLDVFGRPARTSACECERIDAPALGQALELVNSAEIQRKLSAKDGFVAQLAANDRPHEDNVKQIFLRAMGRPPRPDEQRAAVDFLQGEKERHSAYASLLWSLLATGEFMFNH